MSWRVFYWILFMPEELKNRNGFETHAVTIVVLSIFGLLSWNTWTTYQNALVLREISTRLEARDSADEKVYEAITDHSADLKDHERRISKIEDTRWDENDHQKFNEWLQNELKKLSDRISKLNG